MSDTIINNINRLNSVLFPDGLVKPVKAAGVWILAKQSSTNTYNVLMGEMVKTNPQKPETHMFHKTYSGFSGKAMADEEPIYTAVREIQEETFGLFGNDTEVLELIASNTTQVLKNMGWSRYPVATYLVEVEYSDKYIEKFDELRPNECELQCLKWVPLNLIWEAIDNYNIKDTSMTWGEYNSAANLGKLFGPLNGVYSGVELELQKNKFKYNLPVVASDGTPIEIADYIARTFMEYREEIQKMF
jgi:8-oxo-dGTP pyrophosphatase MutT (NUDIX family)